MSDQTTGQNPLKGYFRQPKIFVKLPSGGKFYSQGSLDVSETGEYAVYSMSAKDELLLKTPDALLNGQATVSLIKSCVPAILEPWNMPSIDLDAALTAIRIATYGENLDIDTACPSCGEENSYAFNLVQFLNQVSSFEFRDKIEFDDLTIYIRPYTYKEMSGVRYKAMEQQNILTVINDDSISDEEKMIKVGEGLLKITDMTIDVISGCITSVNTPDQTVTDQHMIREFIENAPKEIYKKVSDHVTEMKNDIQLRPQKVTCAHCEHEFNVDMMLDYSNFFNVRSHQ